VLAAHRSFGSRRGVVRRFHQGQESARSDPVLPRDAQLFDIARPSLERQRLMRRPTDDGANPMDERKRLAFDIRGDPVLDAAGRSARRFRELRRFQHPQRLARLDRRDEGGERLVPRRAAQLRFCVDPARDGEQRSGSPLCFVLRRLHADGRRRQRDPKARLLNFSTRGTSWGWFLRKTPRLPMP